MTTTKQFDFLNRLTSISSTTAVATISSSAYNCNSANQRTAMTNADGTFWIYQYDQLGQVISGKAHWPEGTPVPGEQFEYTFDDIGNRTRTAAGGDQWGRNLRYAAYGANPLNQYTNRTVPPAVDLLGSATNIARVTVNNQATYRHNDFFEFFLMTKGFNNCGGWDNLWRFDTYSGLGIVRHKVWLVQEVIGTSETYDCKGDPAQETVGFHWWEALKVVINSSSPSYTDHDAWPGHYPRTYGSKRVDVFSELLPHSSRFTKDIKRWGRSRRTGDMYRSETQPSWWPGPAIATAERHTSEVWNCCCPDITIPDWSPKHSGDPSQPPQP